jgi:hypothetical protein
LAQGIVTTIVTGVRVAGKSGKAGAAVTTSSTIDMAFTRLGLSTRLLLSPTIDTSYIPLFAIRHLSTSRRTLQAQPVHNHNHDSASHVKSPRLGTGVYSARDEPGKYVNPYEGGPSALEKAAHLFFFTEIVRGWFIMTTSFHISHSTTRHVASLGAIFPSPIHNHVSFRKGSSFTSLPWRACTSSLSEWRRALHRFVYALLRYFLLVDSCYL